MRKILFVDDDPVLLTMYRNRLQREGFQIESAQDGQEALNMLPEAKPDLVVLDLMLPEVNGVEVLKFIRANPDLKSIPVLVLSNAYITDLASKAMKAGANKGILKNECNPAKLIGIIQDMLGGATSEQENGHTKFYSGKTQAQAYLAAAAAAHADEMTLKTARAEFIKQAGNELAVIRDHCLGYIKNCAAPEGRQRLSSLYQRVHFLSARAGLAGCAKVALLASAFEALLFEIVFKPSDATPSVMHTIAQAVDSLGRLLQNSDLEPGTLNLRAKVLVVDDDAVCNLALSSALKRAHLDPVSTEDPNVALSLLETGRFDVVLLDINMPRMNGFELCESLRRLPPYKTTPVIFITGNGDFQNRARSVLSGGDDLITKPISPLELVLKTTMYLLHAQSASESSERRNVLPDEILFSEVLRAGSGDQPQPQDSATATTDSKENSASSSPSVAKDSEDIFKRLNSPANAVLPQEHSMNQSDDIFTVKSALNGREKAQPDNGEAAAEFSEGLIGFDEPVFSRAHESQNSTESVPPVAVDDAASSKTPSEQPWSLSTFNTAPPSLNKQPLAGKTAQQTDMQNKYSQAFEEISHEVARVIFGEENLTELNVRLARIALERYNVHEIINRLADANDSRGRASRLDAVSA